MRFYKGSKVEVLSRKEVPSGSWHRAEIISGNGHKYMVRYEVMAGTTNKSVMERVTREAIRPCPPPLNVSEKWIPGDIVEVFDNNSWKMATVSKVLGKRYFLIRLLGSSQEFKVSKSDLRMRQYYQDDRWVMIGKVSGNCGEDKHDEDINMKYNHDSIPQIHQTKKRKNALVKDGYSFVNNKDLQESRIVSSQTLKRGSPHCCSPIKACVGAARKFRAVEEEGRRRRLVATYPSLFSEQVDDVASTRQMVGENYMHDRINGFSEMDAQRRKQNDGINLDFNDADSDICSVGSCSISSNNSHKLSNHLSTDPVEDTDGHLSDAESFYRLGDEEGNLLPRKEELAAEIHRLELHAYRCTIEALHASGPLSWEQEAMVTNLRLSLHISNDEHLVELRNLVSSQTSIPIN